MSGVVYKANPAGVPRALGMGATTLVHPTTAIDHPFVTMTVPANSMGPNGFLRVMLRGSNVNSAGQKTYRVKLGGSILFSVALTTNITVAAITYIMNRGAANSQVGGLSSIAGIGISGTSAATGYPTAAIDTTVDQQLVISGNVATAGDAMQLEAYAVEVVYGA